MTLMNLTALSVLALSRPGFRQSSMPAQPRVPDDHCSPWRSFGNPGRKATPLAVRPHARFGAIAPISAHRSFPPMLSVPETRSVHPVLLLTAAMQNPDHIDQPHSKNIDWGATIYMMSGYTLREAAQALGVSIVTVRRHIKSGRLKARLVPTKFGESYIVEDLPLSTKPVSDDTQQIQPLISRIEQLSQEVGYWKAKAELLEQRLLLLEAPKQPPKQAWWQRLFRPRH